MCYLESQTSAMQSSLNFKIVFWYLQINCVEVRMVAIREILLVGCILALGALGKDFKETKDIDLTENKLDEDVPEVPDKWARKRPSLRPTKQPEVTAEETTSQEDSEETELCRNGKMQSPIALSRKFSCYKLCSHLILFSYFYREKFGSR